MEKGKGRHCSGCRGRGRRSRRNVDEREVAECIVELQNATDWSELLGCERGILRADGSLKYDDVKEKNANSL